MTEEQAERLVSAVEHCAEALMVLSGLSDLPDRKPGPIEAIAILLGAGERLSSWPNHAEILERLTVAVEKLEAER